MNSSLKWNEIYNIYMVIVAYRRNIYLQPDGKVTDGRRTVDKNE